MQMSWVAEQNATSSASWAKRSRWPTGSTSAIAASDSAIPTWASSSQPRRWPSRRFNSGSLRRSTTGAQNTLMENMMPTQLK